MRGIAAAFLLLPGIASGATPARPVSEGFIVVDGAWLDAPMTLVYRTNPPGVYVGQSLVEADPSFWSAAGVTTIPETDPFPAERRSRDANLGPIAPPDIVAVTRGTAERVMTFVLDRFFGGSGADALRLELGRFLLSDPDPVAAEVTAEGVHVAFDLEDRRSLRLPPITAEWESTLRAHVADRFTRVVSAARHGLVVGAGPSVLSAETARLFAALRGRVTEPGVTAWAGFVLASGADASVAVPAFHGLLEARFGGAFRDSARAAPFPEGRRGIRVLTDGEGGVALAVEKASFEEVAERLSQGTAVSVDVPFALRERLVRHRSMAYEPLADIVSRLLAPHGARVTREEGRVRVESGGGGRVEADGGTALWHTPLTEARGVSWRVVVPPVVVSGGEAGVDATDWRRGTRAWRIDATNASSPPVLDEESLYVGTTDGRLLSARIRNGRIEWWGTLADEASPLVGRHGVRSLAATNGRLIVLQGERTLHVLDAEEGRVERILPDPFRVLEAPVEKDGLLVAVTNGVVAFDEAGEWQGGRAIPGTLPGAVPRCGSSWVVRTAADVRLVDATLEERARIPVPDSSFAVLPGRVAVASGTGIDVYAPDGSPLGSIAVPVHVTALFADGEDLFALGGDGRLLGIDVREGAITSWIVTDMGAHAHPVAAGGGFFGVDARGRFSAFRTR